MEKITQDSILVNQKNDTIGDQGIIDSAHVHHYVHVTSPPIDEITARKIEELKDLLQDDQLYIDYESWCTDDLLHRFLIARKNVVHDSHELLLSALKFRSHRIPSSGIIELSGDAEWEANIN